MSSLEPVTIRPFCYVIECASVPGCDYPSLYVGTSNMVNVRIANHMSGAGSRWTRAHAPTGVIHQMSVCRGDTQQAVLHYEDNVTLDMMRKWNHLHGPNAWRSVRGGRWSKVELSSKPPCG